MTTTKPKTRKGRVPKSKTALPPAARRQKSDDAKLKAGEKRLTTWLPAEGTKALARVKASGQYGTSDREILNAALVNLAESIEPTEEPKP